MKDSRLELRIPQGEKERLSARAKGMGMSTSEYVRYLVREEKQMAYEIRESKSGSYYYVVKGANGEVLSASEMYSNLASAKRAVKDAEATHAAEDTEDDGPPAAA